MAFTASVTSVLSYLGIEPGDLQMLVQWSQWAWLLAAVAFALIGSAVTIYAGISYLRLQKRFSEAERLHAEELKNQRLCMFEKIQAEQAPPALKVQAARWGYIDEDKEVTAILQKFCRPNQADLEVELRVDPFGNGRPGTKHMRVIYAIGDQQLLSVREEYEHLRLPENIAQTAQEFLARMISRTAVEIEEINTGGNAKYLSKNNWTQDLNYEEILARRALARLEFLEELGPAIGISIAHIARITNRGDQIREMQRLQREISTRTLEAR